MEIVIVIVLGLVGLLLLLVEIFLIPGVTIAAIAGVASLIGSTWYAFAKIGPVAGVITLISLLLLLAIMFVYLVKSKALNVIGLKTNIDSTVTSNNEALDIVPGDNGVTLSRLNPIGKVRVKDVIMEGKSLGELIEEDTDIEVLKVSPTQLIVKTK